MYSHAKLGEETDVLTLTYVLCPYSDVSNGSSSLASYIPTRGLDLQCHKIIIDVQQERAKSLKLPTHITIDAGKTQIAPSELL